MQPVHVEEHPGDAVLHVLGGGGRQTVVIGMPEDPWGGDDAHHVACIEAIRLRNVRVRDAVVSLGHVGIGREPWTSWQQAFQRDQRLRDRGGLETVRLARRVRAAGGGTVFGTEERIAGVMDGILEGDG